MSGSVQFRPEQISAVTYSVAEQWRPDRMVTNVVMLKEQFLLIFLAKCVWYFDYLSPELADITSPIQGLFVFVLGSYVAILI